MEIVLLLLRIYEIMIFVRVITSWVRVDEDHPVMRWLIGFTEPVLEPVRRLLGGDRMTIDFSPLVVVFILQLIEQTIVRTVMQ